jgi:DNA (cytosine-5)-methyltransferase 1
MRLQLRGTMYKIVDLFSGIGGFSFAAEQIVGGFETVAFVERDEYCQKVLRKHWKDVPIYNDIRSFNGKDYKDADIVVGGFPCQPWSVAGSQKGSEDDRDLWHEMVRIIEDIRPRWVVGENVSGFVTMPMGLRRSLTDLESIGYKAIPYLIPAAAVDAKHRRMRCWVVGYTEHDGSSTTSFRRGNSQVDGGSTQGQNKAWELERASRRKDDEFVQTDIFDLLADTNTSNGGDWSNDENIGNKRGNPSKEGRESLQSQNRQTRSSNFESSSKSLADTDNAGDRTPASGVDTEQQTHEQGRADISQSELSRQREDVANTNNNGYKGRCVETRHETSARQDTQSKWRADTEIIGGQSNDGRDQEKSKVDENLRRSRDDCSPKLTSSTGVRGLSAGADNNQRISGENRHQENNDRTLVSQGSKRFQSSKHRGLGEDKAIFNPNKIRSGDDSSKNKGVDNKEKGINVADTNNQGVRTRINGSDDDLPKESRGRGDERTTSTTDARLHTKTTKNGEMGLSEKGDVPYANSKGLQGFGKHGELERKSSENESAKKSIQGGDGRDFRREPVTWEPEPNVGRVAHGVPNRIHRLRCLGNSIVPQVVARIFYAIKEVENAKEM